MRPLLPRSFSTLSQAEEENGQSRIYLGIHWAFDKTEGIFLGRRVGDYVFEKVFVPIGKGKALEPKVTLAKGIMELRIKRLDRPPFVQALLPRTRTWRGRNAAATNEPRFP